MVLFTKLFIRRLCEILSRITELCNLWISPRKLFSDGSCNALVSKYLNKWKRLLQNGYHLSQNPLKTIFFFNQASPFRNSKNVMNNYHSDFSINISSLHEKFCKVFYTGYLTWMRLIDRQKALVKSVLMLFQENVQFYFL